jgi:hypothetical protein
MSPVALTRRPASAIVSALIVTTAILSACSTAPTSSSHSLQPGAQATVEGTVDRVDTAPWAYDGNAIVVLAGTAQGAVTVQLPARWNLCKAPAPMDPTTLKAGERVRAVGTVSPEGHLVVCEQASHRLERVAL